MAVAKKTKSQKVRRLTGRHKVIIDYYIDGVTPDQIREKLCLTTAGYVNKIIDSPLAQEEISRRRTKIERLQAESAALVTLQAQVKIGQLALKAAQVQEKLLDSDNEDVLYKASNNILEKAGVGARKEIDKANQNNFVINSDQINLMNVAAMEAFGDERP